MKSEKQLLILSIVFALLLVGLPSFMLGCTYKEFRDSSPSQGWEYCVDYNGTKAVGIQSDNDKPTILLFSIIGNKVHFTVVDHSAQLIAPIYIKYDTKDKFITYIPSKTPCKMKNCVDMDEDESADIIDNLKDCKSFIVRMTVDYKYFDFKFTCGDKLDTMMLEPYKVKKPVVSDSVKYGNALEALNVYIPLNPSLEVPRKKR